MIWSFFPFPRHRHHLWGPIQPSPGHGRGAGPRERLPRKFLGREGLWPVFDYTSSWSICGGLTMRRLSRKYSWPSRQPQHQLRRGGRQFGWRRLLRAWRPGGSTSFHRYLWLPAQWRRLWWWRLQAHVAITPEGGGCARRRHAMIGRSPHHPLPKIYYSVRIQSVRACEIIAHYPCNLFLIYVLNHELNYRW
jgi:hypothetical protein